MNYEQFSKNLISRIKTRICRKSKAKIRGISGEIGGKPGEIGGFRGKSADFRIKSGHLRPRTQDKGRRTRDENMQNEPNFFRPRLISNTNNDNNLQRVNNNGHLVKTNPIESSPKRTTRDAQRGTKDVQRITKLCKTNPIFQRQK